MTADVNRFHGIYPSTLCPMRPDYGIDEQALREHTGSLAATEGIRGVLCNGHAGENFVLDAREKRRVVAISRDAMPAGRLLIAGVNQESSLAAAEEARAAAECGADAIMVFAPNSWSLMQDGTMALRHHEIIRAATDLPMLLFQGSVFAGRTAFSHEVLSRLVRLPNVVGIKEGSWETAAYEANRRLVRAIAPQVAVMASGDEHLLTSYVLGSEGSLVSLAVIIPEVIVALDAAVRRDDMPEARRLNDLVYPLASAIYGTAPGIYATARLKTCLKLLGRLDCDAVRPPLGPLPPAEEMRLRSALETAGLL